MGISCDNDGHFPLGTLVVIRRGSYVDSVCVVVGIDRKDGKILIADGVDISAGKPKRKNPRHVEATGEFSPDVADRLIRGKIINDGWLCEILRRRKK
jgi:ribosomal protein L14E/L6E/L27E